MASDRQGAFTSVSQVGTAILLQRRAENKSTQVTGKALGELDLHAGPPTTRDMAIPDSVAHL